MPKEKKQQTKKYASKIASKKARLKRKVRLKHRKLRLKLFRLADLEKLVKTLPYMNTRTIF